MTQSHGRTREKILSAVNRLYGIILRGDVWECVYTANRNPVGVGRIVCRYTLVWYICVCVRRFYVGRVSQFGRV